VGGWEGEFEVSDVLPVGFGGDAIVCGYCGGEGVGYREEVLWWELGIVA